MAQLKNHPVEAVEPCECVAAPSAERVTCGVCGKTFAGGSIVTDWGRASWSTEHHCYGVLRTLHCDHCQHLMRWVEACAPASRRLSGLVLSGPGYVRSRRAVDRFLKQHPQATGVLQR